jgi:hypothetical protein
LSVLNCPHSGVEAPTPGDKTATLAPSEGSRAPGGVAGRSPTAWGRAATSGCGETTRPGGRAVPAASLDAHAGGRMTKAPMAKARRPPPRPRGGEVFDPDDRPATAGMAPADLGMPTSERGGVGCASLPIRSHRRRPRERDRRRSLDGGHCARETGRGRHDPSQYRLACGSAAAGPTARPWPPSRATPNRPTGEPAIPCRAAAGRPGRRPCARLSAANLCPQRDSDQLPSRVADRSQAQKPRPTATGTERTFNRRS